MVGMAAEGRAGDDAPGIGAALASVRSRHDLIAVLLAADLYMPASGPVEGGVRARRVERAADVRYPVITEDGERLVPVFTTEAAVLAALPDADRPDVVAAGTVLLAGWPPDAALYLDPGAERSAKVPGDRVVALRDEVLGRPSSHAAAAGPQAAGAGSRPTPAESSDAPAAGADVDPPAAGGQRSWLERLGLRRPS